MIRSNSSTDFESLQVRRFVPASPDCVFRAWTDPEELKKWWGPKGVNCQSVIIDLRVGGQYRIANELPDGSVLWISGTFEIIEKPHLLIYTWIVENESPTTERVEVRFTQLESGTEVVLTHTRIATQVLNEQHQQGWNGCLDGLVASFGNGGYA
ncbi:MAG: SRPBCC domain-containing protein [Gammaproteobacteria bacterium]|nr:SRPBCC domain-containing protein [Gammaproteobacteria bacterium]